MNVEIVPQDPAICFGSTGTVLTANASDGAPPYLYLWNTGETTQSIIVNGSGQYYVDVTDTTDCNAISDTVNVTVFSSSILADAGNDQSVCINNPTVTLNGTVQQASGGQWSGGNGVF